MCCTMSKVLVFVHRSKRIGCKSNQKSKSYLHAFYPTRRRRPACSQVIVQYLTHLQQENNRYSICTRQISKAVQFIKANYWYKMLEVISTRHILHSFRHRPSALLLWTRVLPARLHNGLTVQWETGWSDYLTLPSATKDPGCNCKSSNVAQGRWL